LSQQQYSQYLFCVILIALAGALFNAAKIKTRGKSAMYLGTAFLSLASAVFVLRLGGNMLLVEAFGALTFVLLMADGIFRLSNPRKGSRK
jgi:hypothetical protein